MSRNAILPDSAHAAEAALEDAERVPGGRAARSVVAGHHSRRDWWTRRALATGDGVALVLAFTLMHSIFSTRTGGLIELAWAGLVLPLWVVLFRAYGLYDRDGRRLSHTTLDDVPMLFQAILLGSLGLWAYFRIHPGPPLIASDVLAFAGCSFVTVLIARVLARAVLRRRLGPAKALLVGADSTTAAFARKVRAHPEYRLEPVALAGSEDGRLAEVLQLDPADDLHIESVIAQHEIEHVVISHAALDEGALFELIQVCKASGARISLLPQLSDALGPALEVDDVEGLTVLGLHPPVLPRWSHGLKRGMDIVVSGVMLVLLAPLLLSIALAIKLDRSKGPVLFRQKRVGRGGEPFYVLKFRTMIADAEARMVELWAASLDPDWLKLEDDPRITQIGRFLRRSSLDELPQLWNVLRGQMSLVGPRPLLESQDQQVKGWARGRLDLTPGITGYWQVLGRTNIPFAEMVKLDYIYVTNWSLWGDLRLILRTLPVVLCRRGAN